jgi:hypothetical protein
MKSFEHNGVIIHDGDYVVHTEWLRDSKLAAVIIVGKHVDIMFNTNLKVYIGHIDPKGSLVLVNKDNRLEKCPSNQ